MILFISLQSGFYRVFCLIGLPDLLERCSSGLRGTPGKRVYPKRVSRVRISVFPLLFWRAGSFEPALFGSLDLALLIWLFLWFQNSQLYRISCREGLPIKGLTPCRGSLPIKGLTLNRFRAFPYPHVLREKVISHWFAIRYRAGNPSFTAMTKTPRFGPISRR